MSDLGMTLEWASRNRDRLIFVEDNGDGTTTWRTECVKDPVEHPDAWSEMILRLDHRHVLQFGLTDKMREGLARVESEGVSELQEGISEATEPSAKALARTPGVDVLGGSGEGWQWVRVVEDQRCALDTDGDGDCQYCHDGRGQGYPECTKGKIRTVTWAIDNKPAITAWSTGECIDPCPEFQKIVVPDWVIQAVAQT